MNDDNGEVLAAITLGSNGFHLLLARRTGNRLEPLDHLGENVQLGGSLDERGRLDDGTLQRAMDCLRGFALRLADARPDRVAAIATGTLRHASNAPALLEQAQSVLGVPVQVVSGRDEALLMYLGAANTQSLGDGRNLVLDIGGGSTELVIGQGQRLHAVTSVEIGAHAVTRRFFADARVSEEAMAAAEEWVAETLRPASEQLRAIGWDQVVGTAGSVLAVATVIQRHRWGGRMISGAGLARVRAELIAAGDPGPMSQEVLSPERTRLLPAAVALLGGLYREFALERMSLANGALREGLLVRMALTPTEPGAGRAQ
jgi:exopolyphosphatase / guanosine-5'-triphosphate,3'-diphosphate pyrophosphatase